MRKILLLFLCISGIVAQNQPPVIVSLISPSGTNADTVKIPLRIADAEGDQCTLDVAYTSDNGITWFPATVVNRIFTPNNSQHDTLRWNSLDDLHIYDYDDLRLRLVPYDSNIGTSKTTDLFNVKNFSLYDFQDHFPTAKIDSLLDDSLSSNTIRFLYEFLPVASRACQLSLSYSTDKGVYWATASSDINQISSTPILNTAQWNSSTDLPGFSGNTVTLKINAVDTASNRRNPLSKYSIVLDNEAPSYFWSGGFVDTNVILLQFPVEFPEDMDTNRLYDTSRFTLNYGRKITKVMRNVNSSTPSPLILSYAIKAGPEEPNAGENIEVSYLTSSGTWKLIRMVTPFTSNSFSVFQDTISNIDAFHALFRLQFAQTDFSGANLDNYYLDDIQLFRNGRLIFSDMVSDTVVSPSLWSLAQSIEIDSLYYNSSPFSMKFNGVNRRILESQTIITNQDIGFGISQYLALTDAALLPEVPYAITIDTLFDRAGNFTTNSVHDTFYTRKEVSIPDINLLVPNLVLSGTVRINYELNDPGFDTLAITPIEFQIPGGSWQKATVSGTISGITPNNYKGFFYWQTTQDFPEKHVHSVKLRAAVTDTTTRGIFDLETNIEINNNNPPSISLNNLSPRYSDTTVVGFTITDTEKDTIALDISFSNNRIHWFPAKTTGTTSNINSTLYQSSFTWKTTEDVKNTHHDIAGNIFLKVTPKDYVFGSEKILTIPINTSTRPIVILGTLSGEQHDTVLVSYNLTDRDSSVISLVAQYSLDGTQWFPMATTESLTGITVKDYVGTIKWLSASDLKGIDCETVRIRVTPYDPRKGIRATTNIFHLDNNRIPIVTILPISDETQNGRVPMSVVLADIEFDTLDLTFQYLRRQATVWKDARIVEPLNNYDSSQYHGKQLTFTWNVSANEVNYADSLWIRAAAADNDRSLFCAPQSFYYSDRGPVVNLVPINDEQSGDIELSFSIIGNSRDSLTIEARYMVEGNFWQEATLTGILIYPPNTDSGKVIWKSATDLGLKDYGRVRVQVRAISHLMGGYSTSDYFPLDNNREPSVEILPDPTVTLDKVYLKGKFSDIEYDRLYIFLQYYDKPNSSWKKATLSQPPGPIDSSQYNNKIVDITWESSIDIPGFRDTITVRLAAEDTDLSEWDSLTFPLGQQAPDLIIPLIIGEQSDTVPIPFHLVYDGIDLVTIDIAYSTDASIWYQTTVASPLVFPGTTTSDTILWLSQVDLPHQEIPQVFLRLRPRAKFDGIWQLSNSFTLDNNLVPAISFTDSTLSLQGQLVFLATPLSFTVSDNEKDTVTNACLLYDSAGNLDTLFNLPEELQTLTAEQYEDTTFLFRYTSDKYGDSMKVRFLLRTHDNDTSFSDTLSLLVRRYLGDFNGNGIVDLEDLSILSIAWDEGDYAKNVGPIQGTIPLVTVVQDSLFNFEDLSAFVVSWNYSRKQEDKIPSRDMPLFNNSGYYLLTDADRRIFQKNSSQAFPHTHISMQQGKADRYLMTLTLPTEHDLSAGFLLSFCDKVTIKATTDLTGDFAFSCLNDTKNEALIYATSLASGILEKGQKVQILFTIKGNLSSIPLNLSYHSLSKQKYETIQTTSVLLDAIPFTPLNNEMPDQPNFYLTANPFTPGKTVLPVQYQRLSGKTFGTAIIVTDPRISQVDNGSYYETGTINIFDGLGNTIINNLPLVKDETGNLVFIWEGQNQQNRYVGRGSYLARISLTGGMSQSSNRQILIKVTD